MKYFTKLFLVFCFLLLLGCSAPSTSPQSPASLGSGDAARTLTSLRKVDNYPIYIMNYYGSYDAVHASIASASVDAQRHPWGCSLFAALGDTQHMVFGRNFDWDVSPAVLIFTHPADGYASLLTDASCLSQGCRRLTMEATRHRAKIQPCPTRPF